MTFVALRARLPAACAAWAAGGSASECQLLHLEDRDRLRLAVLEHGEVFLLAGPSISLPERSRTVTSRITRLLVRGMSTSALLLGEGGEGDGGEHEFLGDAHIRTGTAVAR